MPRKGKISKRTLYTAKEYLAMDKYQITGKLKREIDAIEALMERKESNDSKRDVLKLDVVLSKVGKRLKVVDGARYHYVKTKGKNSTNVCWLAQRKYGVALSYVENGQYRTIKIKSEEELSDEIIRDFLT